MKLIGKKNNLIRITAAAFAVSLGLFPMLNARAESIEKDEFGAAYVLKDDGSRDYNNVPALPTDDGNSISQNTIIDSDRHEIGVNGPTRDQSTVGIPDGMSKETYAALSDNVINWSEIPDLVEYRNPTYVKYYRQADQSIETMRTAYDEFSSQMHEQLTSLDETIDGLKASEQLIAKVPGNTVNMNGTEVSKDTALEGLKSGLASAKTGKNSIISAITSTRSSIYYAGNTVNNALSPVRNQLISTVETLVISYKTLEVNRSLVSEQTELYKSLYNMNQGLEQQSLSTAAVTQSYYNQLKTAEKTLSDIDAGMAKLKKNIAMQCGYDASADISIADIPDPDVHYLEGRNYEADKKLAVDGNSSVIAAGKLSNYTYSSDGMKNRALGENEARGKASAAMDALHNELKRQLMLADQSETALKKAELSEKSAKIKLDMGMVGNSEYAGLKMQALSYKATAKINRLNLMQAVNNYKWAMSGVMSIN